MDNPKLITLSFVKQIANEFLNKYHPSLELPIPIEDIVELKLKIRIILIKGLIKDFGVNAFISQGFDSMVIDEIMFSKQLERIRFTFPKKLVTCFYTKTGMLKMAQKDLRTTFIGNKQLIANCLTMLNDKQKPLPAWYLCQKTK